MEGRDDVAGWLSWGIVRVRERGSGVGEEAGGRCLNGLVNNGVTPNSGRGKDFNCCSVTCCWTRNFEQRMRYCCPHHMNAAEYGWVRSGWVALYPGF